LLSFAGELSKTAVWGSYHIAVKSIIFVGMKVADYIFHQTSPSYIEQLTYLDDLTISGYIVYSVFEGMGINSQFQHPIQEKLFPI
jgi:hypothetical protein